MNTLKHIKKLPLLTIGIVLIITLLGVSIYSFTKNINTNSTLKNETVTPANPNITPVPMRLSFEPSTITLSSSGENQIQTDIKIDAGAVDMRSVKIIILCDPKRVKNLSLTQKRDRYSALSYAFAKSQAIINQKACDGTLSLEIPQNNPAQRGSGIVAQLSATITGNTSTEIVILPQSTGTTENPNLEFQTQRVNLELTP